MPQRRSEGGDYTGSEPLFVDALQATSGLKLVLAREPLPHQRRLLEALDVDWELGEPCERTRCDCPKHNPRLDRRRPSAVDAAQDGLA